MRALESRETGIYMYSCIDNWSSSSHVRINAFETWGQFGTNPGVCNAAHYSSWISWCQWGCQRWLSVSRGCGFLQRWTWIVHTASRRTVRDASERDCVALTGTQRIETCLKGWGIEFYFLTAEWPFGSQGGRDRDGFRSRPPCSPLLLPQG